MEQNLGPLRYWECFIFSSRQRGVKNIQLAWCGIIYIIDSSAFTDALPIGGCVD